MQFTQQTFWNRKLFFYFLEFQSPVKIEIINGEFLPPTMNQLYLSQIWDAYLLCSFLMPSQHQLNVYVSQIGNGGTLLPITLIRVTIFFQKNIQSENCLLFFDGKIFLKTLFYMH